MEKRLVTMRRRKEQAEKGTLNDKIAYADWMLYHCPDQINAENIDFIKACYMDGIRHRNVRSMLGMGQLYEEGYAGYENIPAAIRLYKRAYNTTGEEYEKQMALTLQARLYLERKNAEDQEKAFDLIFNSAKFMTELKFAPYAIVMGDMHRDGIAVKKSRHAAYEDYLIAKSEILSTEENRRFLPDILIRYGEIYGFGLYVPKDPVKAEGYFAEAEDLLGSGRRSRLNRERIQMDRLSV